MILFQYFLLLKRLFPDYKVTGKSSKKKPKARPAALPEDLTLATLPENRPTMFTISMIKSLIEHLRSQLKIDEERRRQLARQWCGKTWSALTIDELWTFFLCLRRLALESDLDISARVRVNANEIIIEEGEKGKERMEVDDEQPEVPVQESRKRKRSKKERKEKWVSLMDLYLHMIVAHMGMFLELMDFKNSSTERGESWLGWGKKTLKNCTNRDLSTEQPLRELIIRHFYRSFFADDGPVYDPMRSKIAKEFSSHEFEEVVIEVTEDVKEDVSSFLAYLEKLGYLEEDECWKREDGKIIFNTVRAAREAYEQFHSF